MEIDKLKHLLPSWCANMYGFQITPYATCAHFLHQSSFLITHLLVGNGFKQRLTPFLQKNLTTERVSYLVRALALPHFFQLLR